MTNNNAGNGGGMSDEIDRLRAELSALREQKPVAWRRFAEDGERLYHDDVEDWLHEHMPDLEPLYAAPVPSQDDARDAELWRAVREHITYDNPGDGMMWLSMGVCVEVESMAPETMEAAIIAAKGGAK